MSNEELTSWNISKKLSLEISKTCIGNKINHVVGAMALFCAHIILKTQNKENNIEQNIDDFLIHFKDIITIYVEKTNEK